MLAEDHYLSTTITVNATIHHTYWVIQESAFQIKKYIHWESILIILTMPLLEPQIHSNQYICAVVAMSSCEDKGILVHVG